MAKLPDLRELGGIPRISGSRPVAGYDVSGFARGAAALAAADQSLGEGIVKLGEGVSNFEQAKSRWEYNEAHDARLKWKVEAYQRANEDRDFSTLPTRYGEEIDKTNETLAQRITNPFMRQRFLTDTQADTAQFKVNIDKHAKSLWGDDQLAKLNKDGEDWINKGVETEDKALRAEIIDNYNAKIDSLKEAGVLTAQQAQQKKQQWAQHFVTADLLKRADTNPQSVIDTLRGESVTNRILKIEGTAKNPASSATGTGQFIKETWLDVVKRNRPDLTKGRSDADILALRSNAQLGAEMTEVYRLENIATLKKAGIENPTPGNQYLAHFLGPGGAAAVLRADPNTPVGDVLAMVVGKKKADEMIAANQSILANKTAGAVVAWSENLMAGGPEQKIASMLPAEVKYRLLNTAQLKIEALSNKASTDRSQQLERALIDANAGLGPLPKREDIENDPILNDARRNTLLRQYDAATKGVAELQRVAAKFSDPNAGPFNPHDKADTDAIDKLYVAFGGDQPALQRVLDRTRIVPKTAATSLRGDLASGDLTRVAKALQTTSNIMAQHPTAFVASTARKDFEDAAVTFAHNTQDLGLTAEQAARQYIDSQTPEYQAKKNARIKSEDLNEIVKKQVTPSDVRSAFDTSWWPGKPQLAFNPETRQAMYNDYVDAFKEAYSDNGDVSKSKAVAADAMKKTWGVTSISGSEVIVRYPPERAPVYAGVDNAAEKIAAQAIKSIKEETGFVVERSQLRLDPVPGGRTATAYWSGQLPPYIVSWQDKNGVVHYLNPGRAFIADPNEMKADQTSQRQTSFERMRLVSERNRTTRTQQRATMQGILNPQRPELTPIE